MFGTQGYTCWFMLVLYLQMYPTVGSDPCNPCSCGCHYIPQRYPRPCVDCTKRKLLSIPRFPFNLTITIRSLLVYENPIKVLERNIFDGFFNLEVLDLHNDDISNITEDSFNGLQKLEVLDLSSNHITAIKSHTFRPLERLETLVLSDNKIVSIHEDSFAGLKALKRLHLTSNAMETLESRAFWHLGKLEELVLHRNGLSRISNSSFLNLFQLKIIDLSHNNLKYLDKDLFTDLLSLEELDLSACGEISTFEREIFTPLRNLQTLVLHNSLKDIPESLWLPNLSEATLIMENNFFGTNEVKEVLHSDNWFDSNRVKKVVQFSCQLLNDVKQLQHRVKNLVPDMAYFEKHRKENDSVCEEERNFALGMKTDHGCGDNDKLRSGYNIIDGNFKTMGACRPKTNNATNYLRIDLPGVIVVTNVIVMMNYKYQRQSSATVAVGDKLTGRYQPCDEFNLNYSSAVRSVNNSCERLPSGRDVKIEVRIMSKAFNIWNVGSIWKISHLPIEPSLMFYDVMVKGYEENKYNLWSNWNQWGTCSETCDNGVQVRKRSCTKSTSVKCLLPGTDNQRALEQLDKKSCNLQPCFRAVYQWTIGAVAGVFILTMFGIVFWYRKFKMVTFFDGLRPNPNFEMDPDRTLLEQIEELPYDLHWEFPRYDVRFGSVLGEGHFGKVWHAKAKGIKAFNPRDRSDLSSRAKLAKLQDQRVHDYFTTVTEAWVLGDCDTTHHYDVAVKTLKECATPQHKMDLASELKLLIYMDRHPNIVNVLAACTIRGDLWVILEFCNHGCLKNFLSDRRNRFHPSWSKDSADIFNGLCLYDLLQMSAQIMNGVMFLHCWKVIHRDLSARNILVDADFQVKIADFGLARSDDFVASVDDIMPIKWSSLESLLRHEYSTKSDMWSVGVLIWEIFSLGEMPYPGITSRDVIQQLKEGYRMSPPDHCPEEVGRMISDCWNADPKLRPSAADLFEQLDELKVSICTGPSDQYYGASDYGQAGTVQGPSVEELLAGEDNTRFEEDEPVAHTATKEETPTRAVVDIHKTLIEDDAEESGSRTMTYDQYRNLEVEMSKKEIELSEKDIKLNKREMELEEKAIKLTKKDMDLKEREIELNKKVSEMDKIKHIINSADLENNAHRIDKIRQLIIDYNVECTMKPIT